MANKGGMASGVEVARISVKVSPDTREFRRELKRELDDIEKTVKGKVNVEADADTAKAEEKLDKTARNRTAKVKVETDDRGWQQKLKDRAADLRNELRLSPKYDKNADISSDLNRINHLMKEMDSYKGTFSNDIGIDSKVLRARWEAALNEIDGMAERHKVKVDVDVDVDKDRIRKEIEAAMRALSGGGGGGGGGGGIGGGLGPKPGKSPFFPSFGTGINLGGYVAITGLVLDLLAPAVGVITTGLMAMPGLITAMIAPIGVVAMGMDGIAKAATESGLFKDTKPGKKGGGGVGGAFDEIKGKINDTFAVGMKPAFDAIAQLLDNDKFQAGAVGIAKGVDSIATSIAKAVSEGPGLESINSAVAHIGDAMTKAAPGWSDFTTGMAQLVDQLTAKLPDLSEWFNGAGKSFKDWISKISENGQLSQAFDGLGKSLKVVVDFLGQLGSKGLDFMSNPQNIQTFISQLEQVAQLIERIVDASAGLNNFLSKFSWMGDIGNALSAPSEAAKPEYGPGGQSIGFQLAGGLGHNFEQQIKSAFGDKDAKAYLDKLYADSGEAGTKSGLVYSNNFKTAMDSGRGGALPNASRERRGLAPVPIAPDTNVTPIAQDKPKVEPPDTSAAKAALQDYQNTVTTSMNAVKQSIEQATTDVNIQPPDLSGFETSLNGLGDVAAQAMQAVVTSVEAGGQQAAGAALLVGNNIYQALASTSALFQTVGLQMMAGLAAGINAGSAYAITAAVSAATNALNAAKAALGIKSPSRKFMEVGNFSMQGMAIGMDKGFGPVLAQAKDLASQIAGVFSSDGDPTSLLQGFGGKEVSRMEKVLAFESKRLGIQAKALDYQAKTTGNEAFKAQAEAIRGKKEELDLQKEMMDLTKEYSDLNGPDKLNGTPFGDAIQSMMGMPQDFAKATGQQFMQDIGIGGDGALGAITDYATGFANKFVFNVSNIDEAMAVHQNQVNKQAAGVMSR